MSQQLFLFILYTFLFQKMFYFMMQGKDRVSSVGLWFVVKLEKWTIERTPFIQIQYENEYEINQQKQPVCLGV